MIGYPPLTFQNTDFGTNFNLESIRLRIPQNAIFQWEIRKVKAVSPSPFYDGTYHPSLFRQLNAAFILKRQV